MILEEPVQIMKACFDGIALRAGANKHVGKASYSVQLLNVYSVQTTPPSNYELLPMTNKLSTKF